MKKTIFILILIFFAKSLNSQEIHSFYYLDVPRSKASEFVKMHKKFTDIYFLGSQENKMNSSWLFSHTYGSNFTFKIIEVYENSISQASSTDFAQEVNKNIDNMDISYDEKKMLKDEWRLYFGLFLENHTDELRVAFPNQFYITDGDFDFSKKHIVVFNKSNPRWSDRSEYISLWNEITRQPAIELGETLAIVPTGHYSGSSYTFQAAFWYKSWESFVKNHRNLENFGPMSEKQKRMWDIGGEHNDEIVTYLGSTWSVNGDETKTFTIAQ
ncbi:MAG: hypothetical protein ISP56_03270 [Flavobacteriaceae bacterium]|nr:hypothetical protein [Flavobacteriaceae bacterium]